MSRIIFPKVNFKNNPRILPTIKTLMGITAYSHENMIVADIDEVNRVISKIEIIKISPKITITTKAQRADANKTIFGSFQKSDLSKTM